MKKRALSQSGIFHPRVLVALILCSAGVFLAMLSFAATLPGGMTASAPNSTGDSAFVRKPAGLVSSRANAQAANVPFAPAAATPSDPSAPSWSIVPSPNELSEEGNALYGVTCVSASDCWAVGISGFGFPKTLIERWNGTSWAIVASPNTSSPYDNRLYGVTCISASECWAVGYAFNGNNYQTLIEQWNGTAWAIVTSPNPSASQNNFLSGVTCASASDCWAVGYYVNVNSTTGTSATQTLIEQWNGTSWSIVASPNTTSVIGATQDDVLSGVTCASASNCWAVGYSSDPTIGIYQSLIEQWDGTSWTVVTSPNTSLIQNNYLFGVTCASASECWAVGYYYTGNAAQSGVYRTLIEQWNGTSWAIVTSPNNGTSTNYLLGVTCASASECWAVGNYYNGSVDQTLIEQWNGTSWSIVTTPNSSGTQGGNFLSDVTCTSAAGCWAVGNYYDLSTQTLIEQWNGTSWAIVNSPNNTAIAGGSPFGVTCTSASDCWAVGLWFNDVADQTLIERWDGSSWAIVDSPSTGVDQSNWLYGVTCTSASDCWTVGFYFNHINYINQTLIEHWDGSSWAIVSSPNTSSTQINILYGLTCTSAAGCWAVGAYFVGNTPQTLIERWDGSSWAIIPSPNTSSTARNSLSGVTCTSASDCWAVGDAFVSGVDQTLVEHWDGSSWAIVSSPDTNSTYANNLSGVTCISASDCWAVGYAFNAGANGAAQTLTEHWDGSSWVIVNSQSTDPTQDNYLASVTCPSASQCWAVGYYFPSGDTPETMIEQWDGSSWSIATSPHTSATAGAELHGVTCVSASDCWAVGPGPDGTLIEHYSVPPVQLVEAVSRKVHGSAGPFDIILDCPPCAGLAPPGIECRSGGANGDYTLVFTFANTLSSVAGASVTTGTGSVSSNNIDSTDAHNYIVNLTGITNAQIITVSLGNVYDSAGNFSSAVSASMSVLIGDTNGDGFVNSADISQTKSQSGNAVMSANFREDVNADGFLNSADISLVKSQSGTALP